MYHHLDAKPIGASKHNQGYKEIKPGNTGCDNTVSKPEKSSMDLLLAAIQIHKAPISLAKPSDWQATCAYPVYQH